MRTFRKAGAVVALLVAAYRVFGCASPTSFGCVSGADDVCTCAVDGVGSPECQTLPTGAVYGCTPDPAWPSTGECVCVPYSCTTTTGNTSACMCGVAASLPESGPFLTTCPAAPSGGVCCLTAGTTCACTDLASTCASAGLGGTEVASCSASGVAASTAATGVVTSSCPTTAPVSDAGSDG